MLTWMGFIGKLIEFTVSKLLDKKINLALDQKKVACKTFIRFYDALLAMELVFSDFMDFLEKFSTGKNSHIYRSHLEPITTKLADASNEFVRSLTELLPTISIYDSQLAVLFGNIVSFKVQARYELSSIFETSKSGSTMQFEAVQVDNEYYRGIRYTIPSDEIMEFNLDKYYQWKQDKKTRNSKRDLPYLLSLNPEKMDDVLSYLVEGQVVTEYIGPEEIGKLNTIYPKLKSHQILISQARNALQEFIRSQFSLEDLLYVKKHS